MTESTTHHVLVRKNADASVVSVTEYEDAESASSSYDLLVQRALTDDDIHGVTYELRDRFGIRSARLIK